MKTVLILRHAKSDWGNPGQADFDRPLAKRGLEDAPRMGDILARFDYVPDKILASPALRAKQTAQLAAEGCGYRKAIQWEESFYGGGSEDLIAALKQLPATVEKVLLIGHNPTLEETAAFLCQPHAAAENWTDSWSIKIPTAGLLCINFDMTDWTELEPGEGVLQWFVIPKLVKALE